MKLAEALSQRAQLNIKISQLKSRLKDCIKIQEGDDLTETPEEVINELDVTLREFSVLVYRINMTNTITMLENGENLTSLLARRDALGIKVKAIYDALQKITAKEDRFSRNEIRYVRTVDVKEFRNIYDKSAAQLRQLDLTIQALGFKTELVD